VAPSLTTGSGAGKNPIGAQQCEIWKSLRKAKQQDRQAVAKQNVSRVISGNFALAATAKQIIVKNEEKPWFVLFLVFQVHSKTTETLDRNFSLTSNIPHLMTRLSEEEVFVFTNITSNFSITPSIRIPRSLPSHV
jgi:hypothetical protein